MSRRPPDIVANSQNPAGALGAFIMQELERWGFHMVVTEGANSEFTVTLDDGPSFLAVTVTGPIVAIADPSPTDEARNGD